MKIPFTILFLLFTNFLFAQEEKRLALVVGNSNYEKGALKNPVNDARLMAKTLDSLEFDVILKERRKAIIVPRETPLSLIHLENLLRLTRAGACILPPCPAFYQNPKTLSDQIDFVVGKVCEQLGISHDLYPRYQAPSENRQVKEN